MNHLFFASLALFCVFFFVACSEKHAGGVTDIGNSVAGVVVMDDGSPAVNARVVVYFDRWDNVAKMDSLVGITDSTGNFKIDGVEDSSRVLFASLKEDCGMEQVGDTIVISRSKRLQGRIATETSGHVRIVGSILDAKINANGEFTFDSLPPGEISIAYISESGNPQSRFVFRTIDNRDSIHLPDLVEEAQMVSWLVIADHVYYSDYGFGGFVASNEEVTPPVIASVPVTLGFTTTETLYGFVLPVKFTTQIDFAKFSSPEYFSVLTAEGNSLPFEVDYWTLSASQGLLWVRLDSIPAGTDSLNLYLALRSDSIDMQPVFRESDYVAAALHLNGDATISGATTSDANYGVIGYGATLTQGQYIDLDSLDPCVGDFTLSIWAYWAGPNDNHQILFSQRTYWSDTTSRFQWHYDNINKVFAAYNNVDQRDSFPEAEVPQNEWAYLTLVFKDGKLAMYVNAVQMGEAKDFVPTDLDITVPFRVGGDEIAVETWNGSLDEVRVELTARSAEWIRLNYETQKAASN